MAKATRITFKGQTGSVRKGLSLYSTKPYLFVPDTIAGMPNRESSFIPLSQAELDAAR